MTEFPLKNDRWPVLGCGLGLRSEHYETITKDWPQVDWFEAISENFMDTGGRPVKILEQVRKRYPVGLHGVAMSIGSTDPLNIDYLKRLKLLVERIDPAIVSDHLCWSGVNGKALHDLLPLPFTKESLAHVVSRIMQVQEFLARPILIENVSTYVTYQCSTMTEWDFLAETAKRSGCGILLDVNNIFVNATNHDFSAKDYLEGIPTELVGQIHLAGHTNMGKFLFDTHSASVLENVWQLYEEALKRFGKVSTLIERDENIPPFYELLEELKSARSIYEQHEIQPQNFDCFSSGPKRVPIVSSTKEIHELQDWMLAQIHPMEWSKKKDLKVSPLNPQGGDPGIERMAVYAGGYIARTRDGLRDVYEAVHHLVGAEVFWELAENYAKCFESKNYNLNAVGEKFPEFLRSSKLIGELPFLPDLAEFEKKISNAFHAFDQKPVLPEALTEMAERDWENARLFFQPYVNLFSSDWPVLDLWDARKTPVSEIKISLVSRPQKALIYRVGLKIKAESISNQAFQILSALLAGKTLGEAIDGLTEVPEGENLPLTQWFSDWVSRGMVHAIDCR